MAVLKTKGKEEEKEEKKKEAHVDVLAQPASVRADGLRNS
jgi:hypothetical protein